MAKRIKDMTLDERRAYNRERAKRWRSKHLERLRKEQAERRAKYPERTKEVKQKWKALNKNKIRNYGLVKNYGITIEEYDAMNLKQKGVCAICKQPETKLNKNGTVHKLAVDHCHKTGKVRGLLCFKCNAAIGFFEKRDIPIIDVELYLAQYRDEPIDTEADCV